MYVRGIGMYNVRKDKVSFDVHVPGTGRIISL